MFSTTMRACETLNELKTSDFHVSIRTEPAKHGASKGLFYPSCGLAWIFVRPARSHRSNSRALIILVDNNSMSPYHILVFFIILLLLSSKTELFTHVYLNHKATKNTKQNNKKETL